MRVGRGQGRPPSGEVVVVFADVETRDRVCSYARNLAQYVDSNNKPTAGVRMYVPTHLGGVYKTLLQYGFNMRERYGPEFRRNIRFDDGEMSLCIDIKVPGKAKWVTVSHAHALADSRKSTRSTEMKFGDALSSTPTTVNGAPSTTLAPPMLQAGIVAAHQMNAVAAAMPSTSDFAAEQTWRSNK